MLNEIYGAINLCILKYMHTKRQYTFYDNKEQTSVGMGKEGQSVLEGKDKYNENKSELRIIIQPTQLSTLQYKKKVGGQFLRNLPAEMNLYLEETPIK